MKYSWLEINNPISSRDVSSTSIPVGSIKKYEMMKKGESVSEIKLSDTIKEGQKKKKKKTAKAE